MNPTIIPILRNTSKIAIPIIADLINNNAFKSFWFKKTKGTIMEISEKDLTIITSYTITYLKQNDLTELSSLTPIQLFNDFINYFENLLPASTKEIALQKTKIKVDQQLKELQNNRKCFKINIKEYD
jgi:hypothetical protein